MIPGIYGVFPTADGWIAIVGVVGNARDLFYRTIGRPDLIERFTRSCTSRTTRRSCGRSSTGCSRPSPTAEWCELLDAAGLRFAPVRTHDEVADDPGVRANGYITAVEDAGAADADAAIVRPPVRFSDPVPTVRTHVPELGQHTEEVLLEAGYSWDEIATLAADGAI